MNWADFWAPNLVQWLLGGTITALVGLWVRRMVKLRADRVDRILRTVEHILGTTTTSIPVQQKAPTVNIAQARKAIAAGFGIILTGLLTWIESTDLEPVLGPLVPEPFRPLIGVALGGFATIASVYMARNEPATADTATDGAAELAAATAAVDVTPLIAATPAAPVAAPTLASIAAPTKINPVVPTVAIQPTLTVTPPALAATSRIELLPVNEPAYQ